MADRSFKEYVANHFYDELFAAIKEYIEANSDRLDLYSRVVSNIDAAELSDIDVKMVGVEDQPEMRILFDVVVEAEIEVSETTRHYDESDLVTQWFDIRCTGNLDKKLSDFEILNVASYNQKSKHNRPLSDSLVPILYKDQVEEAATAFLRKNYPKALKTPMALDVSELAREMGLTIKQRSITSDFSVFGQICFEACDIEVFDEETGETVTEHFDAKTILVDPKAYYLRNLGAVNNTIVHECVHWDRHRKAFKLEQLYNSEASQIRCLVVGGVKDSTVRSANDWMEWQANTLAPRIQMPLGTFKIKASEYIKQFRKERGTFELVDVMEPAIDALATFFCVSRQAAKIRMVDAGYEEAIGAFTFIDGRYVPPHAFKKGSIGKNQTFSISVEDAAIIDFSNAELAEQISRGAYVFVDSHICLNKPKYVARQDDGGVCMTEYGRLHVDECCLAFDLTVKAKNKYGEEFYKECVLFRDVNSGMEFMTSFSKDINGNIMAEADAILNQDKEITEVLRTIEPMTFRDALAYLMTWVDITEEKLSEESLINGKKIQRMRNRADYPKDIESVVAVCIGMHLPPEVSRAMIGKSGFGFRFAENEAHILYNAFINKFFMYSVRDCNAFLVAKGLDPLAVDTDAE